MFLAAQAIAEIEGLEVTPEDITAAGAESVSCTLPPIKTRVSMACEGRDKTGYVREGYAFSPMFTLGYTGTLREKEGFATWLRLERAD